MILPVDMVIFLDGGGAYSNVNIQIPQEKGGTYQDPIVFVSASGNGVHLQGSIGGSNASASCFNLAGSRRAAYPAPRANTPTGCGARTSAAYTARRVGAANAISDS